jgi:hypothetical protein
VDTNQRQRSIELLLEALAACHPTDEDKLDFFKSGLANSTRKTATYSSAIRGTLLKVLKKFAGEHKFCVTAVSHY